MEILTGGRQSGKNLYNALKLYNYIDSLQNDTTVRVVKNDGILALCVDKSISKEKIKDKLEELNKEIKSCTEIDAIFKIKQQQILQELLESEK